MTAQPEQPPRPGSWDADVLSRLVPASGAAGPVVAPETEPSGTSAPHKQLSSGATAAGAGRGEPGPGDASQSGEPGEPGALGGRALSGDTSPWQSRQAARLAGRGGTTPWRRRLEAVHGVIGSDDRPERLTRATTRCQTAVSTGRRVAVVAAHGGAGASTLTIGLGMVLAGIRRDWVAVVAGRADRGLLEHRLGVPAPTSTTAARDLLVAHQSDPNVAPLDHLAVPEVPGLRALTQSDDPAVVLEAASHLSRRHAVTLVDAGILADHPAVAGAHGVLVTGRLSLDGAALVHQLLGELVERVRPSRLQVVLVEGGDTGLSLTTARKLLSTYDVPVVALPRDRHLASGGRISVRLLSDRAVLALTEIAAATLDTVTRQAPAVTGQP